MSCFLNMGWFCLQSIIIDRISRWLIRHLFSIWSFLLVFSQQSDVFALHPGSFLSNFSHRYIFAFARWSYPKPLTHSFCLFNCLHFSFIYFLSHNYSSWLHWMLLTFHIWFRLSTVDFTVLSVPVYHNQNISSPFHH